MILELVLAELDEKVLACKFFPSFRLVEQHLALVLLRVEISGKVYGLSDNFACNRSRSSSLTVLLHSFTYVLNLLPKLLD